MRAQMKSLSPLPALALVLSIFLLAGSCKQAEDGATLLHWAVRDGNDEIAKALVESGKVDINARDDEGRTPLLVAAEVGNIRMLDYLLKHKATLAAQNRDGMNVFHLAAQGNKSEVIRFFSSDPYKSASLELQAARDKHERLPIEVAYSENRHEVAAALVTAGCPVDWADRNGTTLLHWASSKGYDDVVQLLVARGVKLDVKDRDGFVALHLAATAGNKNIVAILIKAGADSTIPWPHLSWFRRIFRRG
jgi:ankyrin repeat protein